MSSSMMAMLKKGLSDAVDDETGPSCLEKKSKKDRGEMRQGTSDILGQVSVCANKAIGLTQLVPVSWE